MPDDSGVWVHVCGSYVYDCHVQLPPPGGVLRDEGVYASGIEILPTLDVDGVVPIPGRDPLERGRMCYWLTGTVGRYAEDGDDGEGSADGCFLITSTGGMRLLGQLTHRFRATVQPGSRVTLECSLSLVAGYDWSLFNLPEEWSWNWRVLATRELKGRFNMSDYALDIEPTDGR